jgi:hypothetical protein
MQNSHRTFRTGFGQQAIEIDCNNEQAYGLAKFLFADFPGAESAASTNRYDILAVDSKPMLSLWNGDKRIYFGESRYQLAYILMNEVIYHCINRNDRQHALHAGAVSKEGRCFILPGKSGTGKSTFTAWLTVNGFQYLTDELVFLGNDGTVSPLTRPINLKVNENHESWLLQDGHNGQVITSNNGSMIPHRLLNSVFSANHPRVTDIIFPEFKQGVEVTFTEISPARSCLHLMQSHVNARNFDSHGIAELSAIVRQCRSYRLVYGSFADLEILFNSPFGLFP